MLLWKKNNMFEEYPLSIEILNIIYSVGNNKHFWEMIELNNMRNIDLRSYDCAVYFVDGLLYFFGGRCKDKNSNRIFFYNFESRFFEEKRIIIPFGKITLLKIDYFD